MKLPLAWLDEYLDLNESPENLAERLSIAGLEVDHIHIPDTISHVISAKITDILKHPNADKLVITQCFDGTKTHQIVTGAKNIQVSDIVPLALPGATLAKGFKIKKSKLRGIESDGMLCSEQELGLCESAQGIWILDKNLPLGQDIATLFKLNKAILDIDILPNRGDCLSIIGLAREIAAIYNIDLKKENWECVSEKDHTRKKINNEIPEQCSFYTLREITDIKAVATPSWMKVRLFQSGLRPIQLNVDICNYVMLEYGQPLHSFDALSLKEDPISIKNADKNQEIQTLDGKKHLLKEQDIIISTNNKAVAIAGVMGDLSSASQVNSKSIFLESAQFNPVAIRRTAKRLDLRSDSSIRFEKGIDAKNIIKASERAAYWFKNIANAKIFSIVQSKPLHTSSTQIAFSVEKINRFLGTNFSDENITMRLTKLGFKIQNNTCFVPSWRQHDCTTIACLAEEVLRLNNLNNIPQHLQAGPSYQEKPDLFAQKINNIRQNLAILGFNECVSFPMISDTDWQLINTSMPTLRIQNPIKSNQAILRNSLIPGLFNITKHNYHNQQDRTHLFEIGNCFENKQEQMKLCIMMSGPWYNTYTKAENDFGQSQLHHLLGLLNQAGLYHSLDTRPVNKAPFFSHPTHILNLYTDDHHIGSIFELHPEIIGNNNIQNPIYVAELNLNQFKNTTKHFKTFSKFPTTRRDIAILANKTLSYQTILNGIHQHKHQWVKQVKLVDHYQGSQLGENKKSLAFALFYQSSTETLNDQQVNEVHHLLCSNLCKSLDINIR